MQEKKIGPKTVDVVFIEYALNNNINCLLVVNSEINEISNKIITEARGVVYFENIFYFKSKVLCDPFCNLSTSDFLRLVLLHPLTHNQGEAKELRLS